MKSSIDTTSKNEKVLAKIQLAKKTEQQILQERSTLEKKEEKTQEAPKNINTYTIFGYLVLLLSFGLFGAWAAYAPLASSVVSIGQMVVSSRVKNVQHLEGGIIDTILVKNGDVVEKGDPLVKIDVTQTQSQLQVIDIQLDELLGEKSRLLTERDNKKSIKFPKELLNKKNNSRIDKIIQGQKQIFKENKLSTQHEFRILEQRIKQLKEISNGLDVQMQHARKQITSQEKEMQRLTPLLKRELLPQSKFDESERRLFALRENISEKIAERAKTDLQINETMEQQLLSKQKVYKDVISRLRLVETKIPDMQARKIALEDTIRRKVIIASVSGVINNIQIHTEGGIIKSGNSLMEIVPLNDGLIIKAIINIKDINKVHKGQESKLIFSTFGRAARMQNYYGTVTYVSADIVNDPNTQQTFYEAYIKIDAESKILLDKRGFLLIPGMPVSLYIKTGERTLLSYLIGPLRDRVMNAFNED